MTEQNRVGHAQHLKAVNHPIRRQILRLVNEKDKIEKQNLIGLLKESDTIDNEEVFNYHMDFLLQSYCIEKIENENELIYKILPGGKVIENF